ncbi:MAG: HAD-IIIC family phosphatase [Akkermansiaceae bacterium]|nr:HAD-IIIC family phosphatase [Verrucomicrobiales bacterium]
MDAMLRDAGSALKFFTFLNKSSPDNAVLESLSENGTLENRLRDLSAQAVLFAASPKRLEILSIARPATHTSVKVRVHRNHAFESLASAIPAWMAMRGWSPEFQLSDYDDTLNFQINGRVDAEIIWVDFSRYADRMSAADFASWLHERTAFLQKNSGAPVLLMNWVEKPEVAAAVEHAFTRLPLAGVLLASMEFVPAALGNAWLDERVAKFSGTRLSERAIMLLARELACCWLPALIAPRLKAVVLDLDNTLYSGVLGEDGIEGIQLTDAHRALQSHLAGLRESGVFLALASRNEPVDVENLFQSRADFPLRWEHFSSRQISWQPKSEALRQIANDLRIGIDAMVFVDDNIGELAQVGAELPGLNFIHAKADAAATLRAVDHFPGLWTPGVTAADRLRVKDLEATREREALLQHTTSPAEYFQSLQVEITLAPSPLAHAQRIAELSAKTNQFNLALRRINIAEVEQRLRDPNRPIVTIQMQDRLSDSGIVGALFCELTPAAAVVDELVISCRSLGRNLEELMIAEALKLACPEWKARKLIFHVNEGPRNGPARAWLERAAGRALQAGDSVVEIPTAYCQPRAEFAHVTIRITH